MFKYSPLVNLLRLKKKITTKLGIYFYLGTKIQSFTTEWSTSGSVHRTININHFTESPANYHWHFQFKIVFGEHIKQLNTEINIKP